MYSLRFLLVYVFFIYFINIFWLRQLKVLSSIYFRASKDIDYIGRNSQYHLPADIGCNYIWYIKRNNRQQITIRFLYQLRKPVNWQGFLRKQCEHLWTIIPSWYELGEEPWLIRKISEMDRSAVLKGFWGCVKIKSSAMHDHLLLLEKGW